METINIKKVYDRKISVEDDYDIPRMFRLACHVGFMQALEDDFDGEWPKYDDFLEQIINAVIAYLDRRPL